MSEHLAWSVWLPTSAATLQLLQVPIMGWARRSLDWDAELRTLSPINRKIVLLFGAGITLSVSGLAIVVIAGHGELGSSRLGFALSVFLALFWCLRAWVQLSWLAPVWRTRLPTLHRMLCVLYPWIGLSYLTFTVLTYRGTR